MATITTSETIAEKQERPVRVGVFSDVPHADEAVARLLQAGFSRDNLSIVCSDETIRAHYDGITTEEPAGSHTPLAVAAGGTIGAIGGFALAAVGAGFGNPALLATGGLAFWSGGIVGGLVAAMMTRGIEKSAAELYSQALTDNKILVAVESHEADAASSLAKAEKILHDAGAEPLALPEG
ncbi:MAG: hypothetical protein K8U03_14605 [Planctomycetia bacterium]|nr:hypothetical protein [Planctomycetia bacterium]